MTSCWYCGHPNLIWDNDFDYSDVYGSGEGLVTFLHCPSCGAEVEFSLRDDNDN